MALDQATGRNKMNKTFVVKNSESDYDVGGENLIDAIENNFEKIARKARVGNAAGYKLLEVKVEYAKGILGGQGGGCLTIRNAGQRLANGFAGEEKITEVWIFATVEDIPNPHTFGFFPAV